MKKITMEENTLSNSKFLYKGIASQQTCIACAYTMFSACGCMWLMGVACVAVLSHDQTRGGTTSVRPEVHGEELAVTTCHMIS